MSIEIKQVRVLGAREVWRIIETAWLLHYRSHVPVGWLVPFAGRRFRRYLSCMLAGRPGEYAHERGRFLMFLAYLNGRPVAAMTVRQKLGDHEVDDLFVLPGHTSLGIGKALLDHARGLARRAGKPLVLWAMYRNYPARRFYEREGARIARRGLHSWYRDHQRNRLPTVCYRWDVRAV